SRCAWSLGDERVRANLRAVGEVVQAKASGRTRRRKHLRRMRRAFGVRRPGAALLSIMPARCQSRARPPPSKTVRNYLGDAEAELLCGTITRLFKSFSAARFFSRNSTELRPT